MSVPAVSPAARVPAVPLFSRTARDPWNDTDAPFPDAACLHHAFQAHADARPGAPALLHGGDTVSYGELEARANRLAHHLRRLGVGPEVRVGICLERGPEAVAAILAVLKAGGAYLPLDPAHPRERLARMLAGGGARVLVTQEPVRGAVRADGLDVVSVDGGAAAIAREPAARPEGGAEGNNLAYVIFTSGSTGEPKGIALAHRGVVNNLWDLNRRVGPGDRVLLLSSLGFDMSVYETLGILSAGGAVVVPLPAEARDPACWAALCRRHGVTVWNSAPALLGLLADHVDAHPAEAPSGLRVAFLGGDWVPVSLPDRVRAWAPGLSEFIVMGGATEASIHSIIYPVGAVDPGWASIPYGVPMANQRAYVLDDGLAPLPPAEAGELYLGGVGLARGYVGRPGLTAERFLPDPDRTRPGERIYRTGDRARRFADGVIELLGRADHQVKLRGFRVEPAEVEAALVRHPGVERAVAVGRAEGGETRLVAYVVPAGPAPHLDVPALHEFLRASLPEYMVPAQFVALDRLPLSPNGKVDRRALPEPPPMPAAGAGGAPRTPAEEAVADEVAAVLGTGPVGVDDDFFALGGHSLAATRLLARLRDRFGAEVPLGAFFAAPTVAALAERVQAAPGGGRPGAGFPRVEGDGPFPLSPAQRRLWLVERMDAGGAAYHVPVALRLSGALDADALERALAALVQRHEALRTVFGEEGGEPVQRIAPAAFALVRGTMEGGDEGEAALRRRLALEAARPFDLGGGPPFRALLLSAGADDHMLLLVMHHLVWDGWSTGVLLRELSALYGALRRGEADPLPPIPVRYPECALWQRGRVAAVQDEQLAWWRAELGGAPALLALATDRPRPAVRGTRGAQHPLRIGRPVVERARALGRAHGATLHMVLMAALDVLLARYAGTDDVVVGTPAAGRTHPALDGVAGFFVNTLAVRADLSGDPTVGELLARVRGAALGAYDHQEVPFDQVVEALRPERSLSHAPLVQVALAVQDAPACGLRLGGAAARTVWVDAGEARFDLTWQLEEDDEGLDGVLEYASDLFDAATAERMATQFARLLDGMAQAPASPISALRLLTPDERALEIARAGAAAPGAPSSHTLHAAFAARARRTPETVAVTCGGRSLSYADLDAWSRRLAGRLRRAGVAPGDRVGLMAGRAPHLVAGMLAVLRAGAAYVPLDPAYPAERLAYMADDAGLRAVLAQPGLDAPGASPPVLLDEATDERPDADDAAVEIEALAYVIYTSGSTGRPKGVGVPHAGVLRLFTAAAPWFRFGARDVWTLFHSYAFDFSVWEIWGALLHGGRLVVVPFEVSRSPEEFYALLEREGVTVLSQTPSAFRPLMRVDDEAAARGAMRTLALREVVFGGEALDPAVLAGWMDRRGDRRPRLVNMYGITETTVHVTARPLTRDDLRAGASPIGVPLADLSAHVLDGAGEPQPPGVPGELYVGGAGVARGYLGRPALTGQRFVPDPFSGVPGARLYRSGDRARRLPSGELEYLGRMDQQVKVRGFRIEPGEIEAVLRGHPAVRDAVVLAHPSGHEGEPRLVAWVVPAFQVPGRAALARELRGWAGTRLPEYMVPSALVFVEELPLTRNGKVDVRALPAPAAEASGAGAAPPRTPAEEVLADAFAAALGVERVGIHDSFFDLGGHSLLAWRLASRIPAALGGPVPVSTILEAPTVAALVTRLSAPGGDAVLPAVTPVPRGGALPLSAGQEALWYLDHVLPGSPAYSIPFAVHLRGALDVDALGRSLNALVERHEALRTTLGRVDGVVSQVVAPPTPVALPRLRLDAREALPRVLREWAERPFDLAAGPLFRAGLVLVGPDEHVLLLNLHHAVADGWSAGIVLRELREAYAAFVGGGEPALPGLPVQYADFAAWQRAALDGGALDAQLAWWRERLAAAPPVLELPADRPRPAAPDDRGGVHTFALPEDLVTRLRALARGEGATLFMVLAAAYDALLARWTGAEDLVVGVPVAGRGRREVEGVAGFFANTLVLRTDLSGNPAFREVLGRTREGLLGAYAHADTPFERLVEATRPGREGGRAPLVQAVVHMHESPVDGFALPGLEARVEGLDPGRAKFELALLFESRSGQVHAELTYAAALFDAATAERLADGLMALLHAAVGDTDLRLALLPVMGESERRRVVHEWNATDVDHPRGVCIHELFVQQARRTPDAQAVAWPGGALTYARLEARSSALARVLRARGVGPDTRVGVCLDRGPDAIVALLAVLRAGGCYVPLDPEYPAERLRYMVEDSRAALVVTVGGLRDPLPVEDGRVLLLDGIEPADGLPGPDGGARPDSLCYLIYTSGSTGRPKGAMVEHRGVPNLVLAQNRAFGLGPGDRVLQFAPLGFDASISEIFLALATGATLCIPAADARLPGPEMVRAAAEMGITKVKLTASALAVLPPVDLAALRAIVLGGEACPRELAARWATPGRRVWSVYGPTEATARVCLAECTADGGGPGWVPLGRVMDNDRVYVLDRWGQPAPAGVPGELMIGGVQVGRGYLGRSGLTAERFVPDPFGAPGARLYRTGDRARWTAAGELEFLGRTDLQVKLRGFRVEPGELEAVLRAHPAVRDAVAAVRVEGGEPRLLAWIVPEAEAPAPAELRAWLRERVPEHLVPGAFSAVAGIPLTPNGKVDRAALPSPSEPRGAVEGRREPRTETEARMARVWAEVLGRGAVGMDEDFFLLGGHSLTAVRLAFRIHEEFGAALPLRALLDAPTAAGAAERMDALLVAGPAASGDERPLAPAPAGEPLPLSIVQEHLWIAEQRAGADADEEYPASVRLEGELHPPALRRALDEIVRRHHALRTVFRVEGARPVQVVLPPAPAPFDVVDLSGLSTEEREGAALRLERTARPFDLERGPLFTVTLVRMGGTSWRLLYTRHHLIGDGWSSGLMLRELSTLYNAFVAGRPSPLPEPVLQYGDWAAWQRRVAQGPGGARELAWWRQKLEDATAVPMALPANGAESRPCGTARTTLAGPVLEWVRALERSEGSTTFIVLLAAVKALLARYTGATDLCLFTPVAGRTRPETAPMIGFFSHRVLLRTDVSGNPTFRQLVGRVRETVLDALSRQGLPCAERADLPAAEAARLASLARMAFACAPDEESPLALDGVRAEWAGGADGEPRAFDSFTFVDRGDRVDGRFDHRLGLYDEGLPEALALDLVRLLDESATAPDAGIFDLPLGVAPAPSAATPAADEPDFDF